MSSAIPPTPVAFDCPVCGQKHYELPDIGWPAPYYWEDSYAKKPGCLLTEDLCVIDDRDFFVRGVIEIPIIGSEQTFGWGVWVSHKKENYEMYRDNFESGVDGMGPFFGWLSTSIDHYKQSSLNLRTMAHYSGDGERPRIILGDCAHPLYRQQRDGISMITAWSIAHHYMKL